jgi:uncharacterized membrane protein
MDPEVEQFLSATEEADIIEAIRVAEKKTSGEIRVHIEAHVTDAWSRAQEVFHALKMDNTKEENGVLFYVAVEDRKFCIMGDRGINSAVGKDFWQEVRSLMESRFRESKFSTGIIEGIQLTGEKLAVYFPWETGDINELTNEISRR